MTEISSVDNLLTPAESGATAYICHSNDSSGNPVVAVKSTDYKWSFTTHAVVTVTGSVTTSTTTSITSASIASNLLGLTAGKYIIQFTSGANVGLARTLTGTGTNAVSWLTALPVQPAASDTYEIYSSTASILSAASGSDEALIYAIIFNK
jgi:hypothetical protein